MPPPMLLPPRLEYCFVFWPRLISPIGEGFFARVSFLAAGFFGAGFLLAVGRSACPEAGRWLALFPAPSACRLTSLAPALACLSCFCKPSSVLLRTSLAWLLPFWLKAGWFRFTSRVLFLRLLRSFASRPRRMSLLPILLNWFLSNEILLRSILFQSTSFHLMLPLKSRSLKQLRQLMLMSLPQ